MHGNGRHGEPGGAGDAAQGAALLLLLAEGGHGRLHANVGAAQGGKGAAGSPQPAAARRQPL